MDVASIVTTPEDGDAVELLLEGKRAKESKIYVRYFVTHSFTDTTVAEETKVAVTGESKHGDHPQTHQSERRSKLEFGVSFAAMTRPFTSTKTVTIGARYVLVNHLSRALEFMQMDPLTGMPSLLDQPVVLGRAGEEDRKVWHWPIHTTKDELLCIRPTYTDNDPTHPADNDLMRMEWAWSQGIRIDAISGDETCIMATRRRAPHAQEDPEALGDWAQSYSASDDDSGSHAERTDNFLLLNVTVFVDNAITFVNVTEWDKSCPPYRVDNRCPEVTLHMIQDTSGQGGRSVGGCLDAHVPPMTDYIFAWHDPKNASAAHHDVKIGCIPHGLHAGVSHLPYHTEHMHGDDSKPHKHHKRGKSPKSTPRGGRGSLGRRLTTLVSELPARARALSSSLKNEQGKGKGKRKGHTHKLVHQGSFFERATSGRTQEEGLGASLFPNICSITRGGTTQQPQQFTSIELDLPQGQSTVRYHDIEVMMEDGTRKHLSVHVYLDGPVHVLEISSLPAFEPRMKVGLQDNTDTSRLATEEALRSNLDDMKRFKTIYEVDLKEAKHDLEKLHAWHIERLPSLGGPKDTHPDADGWQLWIQVVSCRNLLIGDRNVINGGSSDPFCTVTLGGRPPLNKPRTRTKQSCLNPVWIEDFCFTLDDVAMADPLKYAHDLTLALDVEDEDIMFMLNRKTSDFLGQARLPLAPLIHHNLLQETLEDVWVPLTAKTKNEPVINRGDIRLKVQICRNTKVFREKCKEASIRGFAHLLEQHERTLDLVKAEIKSSLKTFTNRSVVVKHRDKLTDPTKEGGVGGEGLRAGSPPGGIAIGGVPGLDKWEEEGHAMGNVHECSPKSTCGPTSKKRRLVATVHGAKGLPAPLLAAACKSKKGERGDHLDRGEQPGEHWDMYVVVSLTPRDGVVRTMRRTSPRLSTGATENAEEEAPFAELAYNDAADRSHGVTKVAVFGPGSLGITIRTAVKEVCTDDDMKTLAHTQHPHVLTHCLVSHLQQVTGGAYAQGINCDACKSAVMSADPMLWVWHCETVGCEYDMCEKCGGEFTAEGRGRDATGNDAPTYIHRVTSVQLGSHAARQGVRVGDELCAIGVAHRVHTPAHASPCHTSPTDLRDLFLHCPRPIRLGFYAGNGGGDDHPFTDRYEQQDNDDGTAANQQEEKDAEKDAGKEANPGLPVPLHAAGQESSPTCAANAANDWNMKYDVSWEEILPFSEEHAPTPRQRRKSGSASPSHSISSSAPAVVPEMTRHAGGGETAQTAANGQGNTSSSPNHEDESIWARVSIYAVPPQEQRTGRGKKGKRSRQRHFDSSHLQENDSISQGTRAALLQPMVYFFGGNPQHATQRTQLSKKERLDKSDVLIGQGTIALPGGDSWNAMRLACPLTLLPELVVAASNGGASSQTVGGVASMKESLKQSDGAGMVDITFQWEEVIDVTEHELSTKYQVELEQICISVMDNRPREVMLLTLEKLAVEQLVWNQGERTSYQISMDHMQLDNQLMDATHPVMLAPAIVAKHRPTLQLTLVVLDHPTNVKYIQAVQAVLQELTLYVEEGWILALVEFMRGLHDHHNVRARAPAALTEMSDSTKLEMCAPFRLCALDELDIGSMQTARCLVPPEMTDGKLYIRFIEVSERSVCCVALCVCHTENRRECAIHISHPPRCAFTGCTHTNAHLVVRVQANFLS